MARSYYVYVHKDRAGSIFYVGKGTDRRAWSRDRHGIWEKYVREHLGGDYDVEIVEDGLSEDEALGLEDELISRYRQQIVNWSGDDVSLTLSINPNTGDMRANHDEGHQRRQHIYAAADRYWRLRKEGQRLTSEAKAIQDSDPEQALQLTHQAMQCVLEYGQIHIPHHVELVERLIEPERSGDVAVIHRMVQVLKKLGRDREIVEAVDHYLQQFPDDLKRKQMASVVRNRNAAARRVGIAERDPYSDD